MTPLEAANKPWSRRHLTRLRQIHRSSGWPVRDVIEVELLVGGLLSTQLDGHQRETLRVTEAGLIALAQAFADNRDLRTAHETLVEKVARTLAMNGRLAWRGLALRVRLDGPPLPAALTDPMQPDNTHSLVPLQDTPPDITQGRWAMACPDVFSVRHTSVEAYLAPVVHEIKVNRADLLGDLKRADKRAAYLAMAPQVYYVLGRERGPAATRGKNPRQLIADPDEVPLSCGVMIERPDDAAHPLEVVRPAPASAFERLPFGVWMALARAAPLRADDLGEQLML